MTYKHIEVVPYNENWPEQFAREAEKIKQALGDNLIEIDHIGSTSVPGLSAKPIIDIIVECKDNKDSVRSFENIGYEYRGEFNIPFRNYFCKKQEVRFNLHVYEQDNPEIELNLKFRDYLRNNPEARDEYALLKSNLLKEKTSFEKTNSIFTGYNLGKDKFIRKILEKIGFNKLRLLRVAHHLEWQEYHRIRREQIFEPINIVYDANHLTITAKDHFHFVLCKGVKIVSIAHVELLNGKEVAIRSLATDAPYKMQGYARYLMQLLTKWIKQQGRKVIKLHANPNAENFYHKLGYINIEFDDVSISEDAIKLGKIL